MKIPLFLPAVLLLVFVCSTRAEAIPDFSTWKISGEVTKDVSKVGPDGEASIRISPKARAAIQLRNADGAGTVSFSVYDDGIVASPDKKKSVGPRWGTSETSGRVLVGGIMYAKFLQPEGSLCLMDTDPSVRDAWLALKFIGPRGTPGWKRWEFRFDPDAGLAVSVDGKAVPQKSFDWNASQSHGFNGIVFYGDESPGATAQTIWIAGIHYEPGPPMKVQPGSLPAPTPPPPPQAMGPAPEEETEKSSEPPILGRMAGFVPGPTLLDDLKNLKVPLVNGYASQHPRLLFFADDREALKKRALERPDLWDAVVASARGVISPEGVPAPEVIRSGAKYWRIERVQSAALAWFVTGEATYRDGAIRWMLAHCKEPIWGDKYRPNLDLVASWYLYHIAVAYDILKGEMTPEQRDLISRSLADHARLIYVDHDPHNTKEKIRYDQNHTYIPMVALTAAGLALLDDVPDAKFWLTRSYAVLRRSRYVLSEDGFYYEGFGYWTYALNWHARGAELLARATGEPLFDLPALRDTWLFGLHLSLPGVPGAFGFGDSGSWGSDGQIKPLLVNNSSMLWEIASQTGTRPSRTTGDFYAARQPDLDYPATAFLWFNPKVEPLALSEIEPYHYFSDHDVIAWRSGWDDDATCYLFRCGPPLGHRAAGKLGQLSDWTMNCGHVHPNIGGFWMFAKGTYLAVDTGYTAEKWTRDHNTLLVDEKGQGMDGSYWNDRGIPYSDFDQAKIVSQFLSADYGFARGEFGSTYRRQIPGVTLTRSLLMTKRWLLIVDDMTADQPRTLTWLCHSIGEFGKLGGGFVSRQPAASLAILPLAPTNASATPEITTVSAGTAPGKGEPTQRGHKLAIRSAAATKETRFINLLLPLGPNEEMPSAELTKQAPESVSLKLTWPDGSIERVDLDLGWKTGTSPGPARIVASK